MSGQSQNSFVIHKNPIIANNVANPAPKKPTFDMNSSLDLGEFSKLTTPKVATKPLPPDSTKGFVMATSRRGQEDFY